MSYNGINCIHIEVAREICNIRCNFCYIDFDNPNNVPYDFQALNKVIDYCRSHDVEAITIQGGEITAIPEGYEFCREIQDMGISLNVMTNGVRLNDGWMKVFSQNCHRVNISINTPNPETYKAMIGFDGWKTVYKNVDAINQLRKQNNPNCEFSISMVLVKQNFHEVVEFYRMARELDVDYVCLYPDTSSPQMVDFTNPTVREKTKELYFQLRDVMYSHAPVHEEDLLALKMFRDFIGYRGNDFAIDTLPRTRGNAPERNVTGRARDRIIDKPGVKPYCKMPSSMIFIDTKMNVHTCCGATGMRYGNLKEKDLDEILKSPKRDELQNMTRNYDYSQCAEYCSLKPRD